MKSRRFISGRLGVIKKHCPRCGHHKALTTFNKIKCSRCGYKYDKRDTD